MLKITDFTQYPEDHPFYQYQRNKEVVQIRRVERQQTFRKKRPFTFDRKPQKLDVFGKDESDEEEELSQSCENQFFIADKRYSDQIKQLNLCQYRKDQLQQIVELIRQQEELTLICGTIALRKLLSMSPPPIQEVIDTGIIDRLLQLGELNQWPQVQLQSIWCITNMASGTTDQCATLITKGCIPLLVSLVAHENSMVGQQAVWALGNISSDCSQFRDLVINAGGVDALIEFAERDNLCDRIMNESCWSLANLCRGKPLPDYRLIKPVMAVICSKLAEGKVTDFQIFAECLWAISYHCDGLRQRVDPIISTGLLEKLIPILNKTINLKLILPGLRVVGQVSTGNLECIEAIFCNGGLQLLENMLLSQKKLLRRESCWIISNIMASSLKHITAILERQSMMKLLLNLFETDAEDVKCEICYVFSNMVQGAKALSVDRLIVEMNVLHIYLELLCTENDTSIQVSLQCLIHILRIAEKKKLEQGLQVSLVVQELQKLKGGAILEKLQYYKNQNIYTLVFHILTTYFELEDPIANQQNDQELLHASSETLQYHPNSEDGEESDDEFK